MSLTKKKQLEWTEGRVKQLQANCFEYLGRSWRKQVAEKIGKTVQTVSNAFNFRDGRPFSRDCNNIYATCIELIREAKEKMNKLILSHFNE